MRMWIDETGMNGNETYEYGWSPKGERDIFPWFKGRAEKMKMREQHIVPLSSRPSPC